MKKGLHLLCPSLTVFLPFLLTFLLTKYAACTSRLAANNPWKLLQLLPIPYIMVCLPGVNMYLLVQCIDWFPLGVLVTPVLVWLTEFCYGAIQHCTISPPCVRHVARKSERACKCDRLTEVKLLSLSAHTGVRCLIAFTEISDLCDFRFQR